MEIFLRPSNHYDLPSAVNAVLAGELEGGWSLRWRLEYFFLLVRIQRYFQIVPRIFFGAEAAQTEPLPRRGKGLKAALHIASPRRGVAWVRHVRRSGFYFAFPAARRIPCRPPIFLRPAGVCARARPSGNRRGTGRNWPAICCWRSTRTEIMWFNFPKPLLPWPRPKSPTAAGALILGQGRVPGAATGAPPSRFVWFQLPRALDRAPVDTPWQRIERTAHSWRLENTSTGEYLEGQFFP